MMTIFTTYLFWQFVILNFVNVLVNTARSLLTIKGGKWIASVMNAICYGYYTIIIVITATYEMPLLMKCVAVAFVNFVGVFTIKFCEEKIKKEKLWIYKAKGIDCTTSSIIITALDEMEIKYVMVKIDNSFINLEIFSETQKESAMIKSILDNYSIKYYAVETMEKNGK